MTSLDQIISFLEIKKDLIGAIQATPWSILLIVTEDQFLKYSNFFKRYNANMKFLEKRNNNILDIHLSFDIQPRIDVTFRVVDYLPNFFLRIKELFPTAEIFVQEIKSFQ
ncbi:MAG: hypothetical protein ACFFAJ_00050 [Candidatus Hodarchaeota archaeon]